VTLTQLRQRHLGGRFIERLIGLEGGFLLRGEEPSSPSEESQVSLMRTNGFRGPESLKELRYLGILNSNGAVAKVY